MRPVRRLEQYPVGTVFGFDKINIEKEHLVNLVSATKRYLDYVGNFYEEREYAQFMTIRVICPSS